MTCKRLGKIFAVSTKAPITHQYKPIHPLALRPNLRPARRNLQSMAANLKNRHSTFWVVLQPPSGTILGNNLYAG